MLNLLPKDQKKWVTREYRVRFWIVVLLLFLAGEVIALILLVPSYLTAQTRLSNLNLQSAGLKVQNITAEIAQLNATVQETSNYLNIFTASTTPTGVAKAIENVVSVRGSSILINNLVYSTENAEQQIFVSGTASSRQALLDFVNKLKIQPGVVSADLPVSDFAKAANIDFSLTVVTKPQNI